VEEAPERATPDLVDNVGLQVDIEGTRNMFSRRSLGEESAEALIAGRAGSFDQTAIGLTERSISNAIYVMGDSYTKTVLNGVQFP
jgi:hypothetical protein